MDHENLDRSRVSAKRHHLRQTGKLPGSLFAVWAKPKYTEDYKCGNVYVRGEYTNSLTIASENDIIINGNITTPTTAGVPNTNDLLGLIANNFVRIYHPVVETYKATKKECKKNGKGEVEKYIATGELCEYTDNAAECDAPNDAGDLNNPMIYAAMLAVKHAVIVDNYICGEPSLGNLNVYGAVAGLYTNGFTGEFSGSSIIHGYPYDANYDDRLQVEEPPHFLNPIEASWFVQRETLTANPKKKAERELPRWGVSFQRQLPCGPCCGCGSRPGEQACKV